MSEYINNVTKKFFSGYRFNSVLFKNFIKIFTLTSVLLGILCVFIYQSLITINRDEVILYNKNNSAHLVENLDNAFSEIRKITVTLATDSDIRNYVLADNSERTMSIWGDRLVEKLISYRNIINSIHSIYIYNENSGQVFSSGTELTAFEEFHDTEWIEEYKRNKEKGFFYLPRKIEGVYPYVISYICNVQNRGCIVVNADIFLISKLTGNDFENDSEVYVLNDENDIIYSNIEKNFMTKFDDNITDKITSAGKDMIDIDGDMFDGYISRDETNSLRYVVLTPMKEYVEKIQRMHFMISIIILIIIAVGLAVSLMLAFNVYEPVSDIVKLIDSADRREVISNLDDNEVKYVATKIMQIIDDNNDLQNELSNRMKEYNDLQFIALRSQINPHFLNNTLNIIVLKLAREVSMESESLGMLTAMTRLIRYAFKSGDILVGFETELEFLHMYIDLLKKRYTSFAVVWDVDEGVKDYKILNVCLQPIVENAVFHGIGTKRENAEIQISIKEELHNICISITDNGVGIEPEYLKQIHAEMEQETVNNIHVGIKNVYRRLKIVYSDEATMKIESEKDRFTKVVICIPKILDESKKL